MLKHVDENGYDHLLRLQHCATCTRPIYNYLKNDVLIPHTAITWQHWDLATHDAMPEKDLGVRTALTHIPMQTNLSFCSGCMPSWMPLEGHCSACEGLVNQGEGHTVAEAFDRHILGTKSVFTNRRVFLFHLGCLPAHFHKIHKKISK